MDFTSICVLLLLSSALATFESNGIKPIDSNEKQNGNHWALLVAGSSGYYNYRHQADICHAYHVMINHGISEDRIVTLMFDDIANSTSNPTPGIIINHPEGQDVYQGVQIDYKGPDVTPENFLSILRGDKDAMSDIGSGRVIESGPDDHVFVNFADHGAPGILAFPETELHARDLLDTIQTMFEKKQYQQMVLYIEACESGSIFETLLPPNISVYATTAANSHESSYACYFDEERKTYLGDVYSVKWMEDSDIEDLRTETLKKQYQIVKRETNTSHVMQYGEMDIADEDVADFQGGKDYRQPKPQYVRPVPYDAVPSEDVPLAILRRRLNSAKTEKEQLEIVREMETILQKHQAIATSMKSIVSLVARNQLHAERIMSVRHTLRNFDCYEPAAKQYDEMCFDLCKNDYALRRLYILVNLCEEGIPTKSITKAIQKTCAIPIPQTFLLFP